MAGVVPTTSPFFEAAFTYSNHGYSADAWHDESTPDFFVFRSRFGSVRLRKRSTYPTTFAFVNGSILYFGYGERAIGGEISKSDIRTVSEELFYFNEFLYAEVDCSEQHVIVQRDALCTVPIFACAQPHELVLSNKFERVCELADTSNLHVDPITLSEMLTGQSTGNRTLLKEVHIVYDRARIIWHNGEMVQPTPPDSSLLHTVNERDGDAHTFHTFFEAVLDRYRTTYIAEHAIVATELSGGTDSSLINQYLASKHVPLHAGTLLYADAFGASQAEKLDALHTHFGISSYRVPLDSISDYPLASMVRSGTWSPFYHNQELYLESYNRLVTYFASHQATVVFRGIGGDELGENIPELGALQELPFSARFYKRARPLELWETPALQDYTQTAVQTTNEQPPLTLLSPSVAMAPACGNNQYLDYNIWPIMPLANPALYLYCQSLPIRYRSRKNLLRAYMKALGFPASIYASPVKEHFGHFFYQSVQPNLQQPFEELMHTSVLAKAGLIDAEVAQKSWASMKIRDFNSPIDHLFALYRLMTIEITLQALTISLNQ